jgi:hypothetical protein
MLENVRWWRCNVSSSLEAIHISDIGRSPRVPYEVLRLFGGVPLRSAPAGWLAGSNWGTPRQSRGHVTSINHQPPPRNPERCAPSENERLQRGRLYPFSLRVSILSNEEWLGVHERFVCAADVTREISDVPRKVQVRGSLPRCAWAYTTTPLLVRYDNRESDGEDETRRDEEGGEQ